ncbi:curli assembly protein CsgF [Pseudomonas monteilii]|jgi:curli production assembly/transport component CsgF|uniref:curli assembly protein CsgF n=1 Tax=Pseudomonas alabamensis TaxID=3064349 RepID=UPI000745EAE9|nr:MULTISPECIES: curli assembly protein CsgF [Pseudomonas]AMA46355.1 curli assembly protein CsgF [Pseudomonas monteilii]MDO7912489.1 curli assembly protein CsgF [Pseudomonas sp. 22-AL-CL-001]
MSRLSPALLGLALSLAIGAAAQASELVYVPNNPSFGGNPLNGPVLLNQATAQNKFTEKSASGSASAQNALTQFNSMLQSAILSRVSSAVTSSIVGADGRLTPGTVETTDFTINITNLSGGLLQIVTTDKTTGQTTQFQINQP